MKIHLIACSNYFPDSFGGTEVYVANFAKFLVEKGEQVSIVAATPLAKFSKENTIYHDDVLKVCRYTHEGINVFGIAYLTAIDTTYIYSKYKATLAQNWTNFIHSQPAFTNLTAFYIQSFTPTIGLNLFEAVINKNKNVKVITSYHTPVSCPKGTLLYGNTLKECHIQANIKDCTTCLLKTQRQLPYFLATAIDKLQLNHSKLPAVFKSRRLVTLDLQAFDQLKKITHEWWCYSEGIKKILVKNGVNKAKIKMARHGINELFFEQEINKPTETTIYLFSGRLVKIKGIITLLEAWLKLPQRNNKQLWITAAPNSDDAAISKLLKRVATRSDVMFLGPKSQTEIAQLYAQAHFVIVPSECFEIGPFVVHEAIANECYVISSNIGGCKELATYYRANNDTFEVGNSDDLTKKLSTSIYNFNTSIAPLTINEHFALIYSPKSLKHV